LRDEEQCCARISVVASLSFMSVVVSLLHVLPLMSVVA
jgi:hypothetical protein